MFVMWLRLQQSFLPAQFNTVLLVNFEKKSYYIFVSIWLHRKFIWVPTQPTLVWSWADAHATDRIGRGFTTSGMQLGTLVMRLLYVALENLRGMMS